MKKTYHTLLRENQDLKKLIDITQQEYRSYVKKAKKQIAELEKMIDVKDQKHWDYYKKMQAAIHHATFADSPTREFLFKHLDSWNKKSNV